MTAGSEALKTRNDCTNCYVPVCTFRALWGNDYRRECSYYVLGIVIALGGLIMNLYALGSCSFQRVQQINHVTGDPIPGKVKTYGLLSRVTDYSVDVQPDYSKCTWYTQAEYDSFFDGWFQTALVFTITSAMLATIGYLVLLLSCFIKFSPRMFERWLFGIYATAAVSIALSFFAFRSQWCFENLCERSSGSDWAIAAFAFHFTTAIIVKFLLGPGKSSTRHGSKEEDAEARRNVEDDTGDYATCELEGAPSTHGEWHNSTVTETVRLPNGELRKTVTKTTIRPNGGRLVERVIDFSRCNSNGEESIGSLGGALSLATGYNEQEAEVGTNKEKETDSSADDSDDDVDAESNCEPNRTVEASGAPVETASASMSKLRNIDEGASPGSLIITASEDQEDTECSDGIDDVDIESNCEPETDE